MTALDAVDARAKIRAIFVSDSTPRIRRETKRREVGTANGGGGGRGGDKLAIFAGCFGHTLHEKINHRGHLIY